MSTLKTVISKILIDAGTAAAENFISDAQALAYTKFAIKVLEEGVALDDRLDGVLADIQARNAADPDWVPSVDELDALYASIDARGNEEGEYVEPVVQ